MNSLSNQEKFKIFLDITKELNDQLNVIPVLYGSLGLYRLLKLDKPTGDIDFLIPDEFIQNKWSELLQLMTDLGYLLQDKHEHEFIKDDQEVAFGKQSDLLKMNNINLADLRIFQIEGISYRGLTVEQYLTCYETVYHDDYRCKKNNNADVEKIRLIKEYLENEN